MAFIKKNAFRKTFSAVFFVPLILMLIIYGHISVIVRKHQARRGWFNRHSRRYDNNKGARNDHQQQFDRNLKAIWTTLLILSTYLMCFMPVVISFILICDDCYFKFNQIDQKWRIIMGTTSNLFLVTKPLLNSLIYASRMQEIRAATRKMNAECRRMLCPSVSIDELDKTCSSAVDVAHQRYSFASGSSRRNHCSINSVHLHNGFASRSTRRRQMDMTTDL